MNDINEYIKILEEWIEITVGNAPEWAKSDEILKIIDYKQIQSIENLIKGYKELEERTISLTNLLCINDSDENYIPKSKIKEKIEELNNYDSEFCQRVINHSEHTLTEFVQNILQELMEDK